MAKNRLLDVIHYLCAPTNYASYAYWYVTHRVENCRESDFLTIRKLSDNMYSTNYLKRYVAIIYSHLFSTTWYIIYFYNPINYNPVIFTKRLLPYERIHYRYVFKCAHEQRTNNRSSNLWASADVNDVFRFGTPRLHSAR